MKERGLASPDLGDCLAMTFAVNIAAPTVKPEEQSYYPGERGSAWMA
jgi:hypothetical protein